MKGARARHAWVAAIASAAFVALVAPASAVPGAPFDQYEKFNRDDRIIGDVFTKLYWQREAVQGQTAEQAATLCADLVLDGSDWRLPTMKELLTLVDDGGRREFEDGVIVTKYIDRMAFPGALDQPFWTSSVDAAGSRLVVDFETGFARHATGAVAAVRCVRP